ncbi:hypothetical protein D3C78_1551690 [compost metagenome]
MPQRLLDHLVFNDMAEMAETTFVAAKRDLTEAVTIPDFHRVIRAGAQVADLIPHANALQQALTGGVNGRYAQRGLFWQRR